ncbi:Tat pathway signal sequence [Diaporthe amygdali]|uniref:Tat pathway signal sequence n=1 Tax=Phomopsis amygdali TaxID=1214568 RepID=UPI0022FDB500|nr:Tat pathway signal sequence [Diaporthe amygdali]KAJ0117214.1 Tat pathway signal sequence [Diaporthe amygdali]
MSAHEKELLLEGDCDDASSSVTSYHEVTSYVKPSSRRWWICAIAVQVVLITIYTAISYAVIRQNVGPESDTDIHAFAGLDVRYKFRLYDNFVNSPYAGEPTPESDAAWHTLLNNMSVRVTGDELARHNQTSVALPGGGYLAWLGVFHELHCVKMLRQWSWREHYFPNMTAHEHRHQMVHIDHCLDWLRNAAICGADTSALAVFKWDEKLPHPMLNTKRVPHRCVDWDALTRSHEDRVVSRDEIVSLKNPLLEGNGNDGEEAVDKLPWTSMGEDDA